MLSKEILRGCVDLHIHAGPSLAKRSLDAAEAMLEGAEAGYRAVVIKDHYFPTMMGCTMVEKHLEGKETRCFGGIVLNNSVGGLNLKAVESAVNMGAKIVWFPTVSARNHIDTHGKGFVGAAAGEGVPEEPIYYLDESGELLPEVVEILKYLARHPEVLLATGHCSPQETDALLKKGFELGLEKALVNHPFFEIGASFEDVKRWAAMGASIEINVCVFENMVNQKTGKRMGPIPFSLFQQYYEELPTDKLVIDTDLGQSIFYSPVTGMYEFLKEITQRFHVPEEDIDRMIKINPARLINL